MLCYGTFGRNITLSIDECQSTHKCQLFQEIVGVVQIKMSVCKATCHPLNQNICILDNWGCIAQIKESK